MALVPSQEAIEDPKPAVVMKKITIEIYEMLITTHNIARGFKTIKQDVTQRALIEAQVNMLKRIIERYTNYKPVNEVDIDGKTECEKALDAASEWFAPNIIDENATGGT